MNFLKNYWKRPGPFLDLGLTLPLFMIYHIGLPFSSQKNVFDPLTKYFYQLANYSIGLYWLYVGSFCACLLGLFLFLDKNRSFSLGKFFLLAIESAGYAVIAAIISKYATAKLLAVGASQMDHFIGSFGAGFYEELVFRVILFGVGLKLINYSSSKDIIFSKTQIIMRSLLWALVVSVVFSAVHYLLGDADTFMVSSFLFRMFMGLCLTFIYATRGFAVAVWVHTIFDIMVTLKFLR